MSTTNINACMFFVCLLLLYVLEHITMGMTCDSVTVCTNGDFIMLPHGTIPLSHIILTLSQLVLVLS